MPVIPAGAPSFDDANSILNLCRVRLNDKLPALFATGGKVLNETDATSHEAFNSGWRRMQENLPNEGFEFFNGDVVIFSIPKTTNMDPAATCQLGRNYFFDGTNYQTTPVLPADLLTPLWISERPASSGGPNPFPFPDVNQPNMRCMTDGLQSRRKFQYNGQWEWRQETVFFPGAITTVDFRMRYRTYLPDINDVGAVRWFRQPVPMTRCKSPLAWWICSEFTAARAADGDATEGMAAVAAACAELAMEETKLMANRDISKNLRTNVRRIPYGGGLGGNRRCY